MAIAVGSVSDTPTYATRTNSTITAPSGITNGDLLVAVLHVGDSSLLPALTVTPPAGWTEVTNSPTAMDKPTYTTSQHVYWKVASSEAGNYTFTHGAADTEGFMYRLTGCNTSTPIDVTPGADQGDASTDGHTTAYPSITTVTDGCFLIYTEADWDATGSGTISGTTPSITTRRSGTNSYIGDGTQTTAGATSARTRLNGNTGPANPWASIVVAIRPGGETPAPPDPDVWEFVGVSNVVEVTTTAHTLVTTGISGTLQAGDLIVAVIGSRIASTTQITLPSAEWTRGPQQMNNSTVTTTSAAASGLMAYCIRGASNPSFAFTHPAAPSVAMGRLIAYRNVHRGKPLNVSTSATTAINTLNVSVTGPTTTENNTLMVVGMIGGQEAAWSSFDAGAWVTSPTGGNSVQTDPPGAGIMQERQDSSTTTGADMSLAIADVVKAIPEATGTFTCTGTLGASHVMMIAAFNLAARPNPQIVVSQAVHRAANW